MKMASSQSSVFGNGVLQILILVMITTGYFAAVNELDNYGPYNLEFPYIEFCRGSKSRNLTDLSLEIIRTKEDFVINVNLTFLVNSHFDEIRIKTFAIKRNQKTLVLNYRIDNPCQHFAIATMIEQFLQANKCIVKKGNYAVSVSMNNVTRAFYGETSFYGAFQTKTTVTSKQGNILCLSLETVFQKKI